MEVNNTQYSTQLQNNEETANELFSAWNKLNVRGLIHASKFIAELMVSIEAKPNVAVPMIADPTYLLAKNYFDVKVSSSQCVLCVLIVGILSRCSLLGK